MARRKNVKRIDPRYFLNETMNRGEELEEGKKEEIQALIDAGMISPEEAKNMLAGRAVDDSGNRGGQLKPDSALKRKVAALAKKFGICNETMVEEIRKILEQ
jgi:hypothetical protein